jgi:hypothetical protein
MEYSKMTNIEGKKEKDKSRSDNTTTEVIEFIAIDLRG